MVAIIGSVPISSKETGRGEQVPKRKLRRTIMKEEKDTCEQLGSTKLVMENQITTLTQYRQSLIHECVTGKKRIYQGA